MIRVLLTGKLHDIPQERESANGNTYAVAKVKADDKGGNWIWASIIAFGDEAQRLFDARRAVLSDRSDASSATLRCSGSPATAQMGVIARTTINKSWAIRIWRLTPS